MNRRQVLAGTVGVAAAASTGAAASAPLDGVTVASAIRGSINAEDFGVWPNAVDDQSRAFRRMLDKASSSGAPIFLPPGQYRLSNIRLPRETRLLGIAGSTRLVYGGDGYLFAADDAAVVSLSGLAIDGANRPLAKGAQALIELRQLPALAIDGCQIVGSARSALALEHVSGRIERTTIAGAANYAVYCVQAGRMAFQSNTITDCGEGGLLVHRWQAGGDGSIVTGNRIERIGAASGGTGQYGNGINIFRADNVLVSNNHVADCAFSAIRANSAGNVQILGNQCLRSGETAVYAEFAFEGAVISQNVVDGAAIGISIANLNEGGRLAVCQGNVVRNLIDHAPYEAYESIGFGIGISAEADTAITGNVVDTAPRFGMLLGWGPYLRNVSATGNVIRQAGEGIAVSVAEGAGTAVVTDNLIDGAARGVVGYRWSQRATDDLAVDGAERFAHLLVERNRVA
jgi:uncharacterized secreted repeat protein (TIGR03808 family)